MCYKIIFGLVDINRDGFFICVSVLQEVTRIKFLSISANIPLGHPCSLNALSIYGITYVHIALTSALYPNSTSSSDVADKPARRASSRLTAKFKKVT